MGSFSQTLFFGGVKRQPEIRLRSQATDISDLERCTVTEQSSTGQHSDRVSTAIDDRNTCLKVSFLSSSLDLSSPHLGDNFLYVWKTKFCGDLDAIIKAILANTLG